MVVAMANNGIPLPVPPLPATVAITPQGAPIRPQDYFENGRKYHGFRKGKYMWPCDEDEKDRMDIYHKLFSVARRGELHATPFTPNFDPGPRVLDLGTGTGIWAIDMAETNKTGEVQGIDLAWIQPEHIPANLAFHQRDIESPWHGMDLESWDLIHMRMLNGSITNWPDTYFKIFRHLKPNFGWMEQVEIDITPRCDDGTLPSDCKLHHWSRYLLDATQRTYRPMAVNPNTRELLASLGFVDIQEQIIRVPLNPWPADPHLKEVGRWYNLGFTVGLEGLTLGPMARMHGWKKPDIDRLVAEVKRDICNRKFHAYNNMHIWIARRPANS